MKALKINFIKYQLVWVFVLLTQLAQAQDAPTFDDDVQDVQVAPIDHWIIPMILLGIVGVFIFYQRQQKQILK